MFCTLCELPTPKRLHSKVFYCSKSKNTVCSWKMACFAKISILGPKVASSTIFQGAIQTPIYVVGAPPRYWIMSTSLLECQKRVFRVIWCIWVPFWVIWILVKKSKFWDFSAENAWKNDPIAPFKRKKGPKNAFQALNFFSSKSSTKIDAFCTLCEILTPNAETVGGTKLSTNITFLNVLLTHIVGRK